MAARLLVEVEGQTEEQVVNEILAPHLYEKGYETVGARIVGNQRDRLVDHPLGMPAFPPVVGPSRATRS